MSKKPRFQFDRYWLSKRAGSKNYCATWYDPITGGTKRLSLGTSDLREAQEKLRQFGAAHIHLRDQPRKNVRLSTVWIRYYENHAKFRRSEETARLALAKWNQFFENDTVDKLTPERQKAFIDSLMRAGYKNEYINRILSVGRAALNYAVENLVLESVPMIKLLPPNPGRDFVLTDEQVATLLDNADTEHIFLYCLIALNTLARPEAILELTKFQLDFENRLINLNPAGRQQTKKYRPIVPMTDTLLPWLRRAQGDYLISYRNKPIRSIKSAWRKLRKRADLPPDAVPYTLRHTMASELRRRGIPMVQIAAFLGHKIPDFRTTERYTHFGVDYLADAAAEIDRYFGELQGKIKRSIVPLSVSNQAPINPS